MPDGYQIIPFDVKNLFKNVPLTDQCFHDIESKSTDWFLYDGNIDR